MPVFGNVHFGSKTSFDDLQCVIKTVKSSLNELHCVSDFKRNNEKKTIVFAISMRKRQKITF